MVQFKLLIKVYTWGVKLTQMTSISFGPWTKTNRDGICLIYVTNSGEEIECQPKSISAPAENVRKKEAM